jgi:hypothetical protein
MDTIEKVGYASPPDRQKHVSELCTPEEQFAEINQENEKLHIEIYPKQSGEPWVFDYDDLLAALVRGKERLVGEGK